MKCSICRHPRQMEMITDYVYTGSLRTTAENFRVGYRSLYRHIKECIYALLEEDEQRDYEKALAETAEKLRLYFEIISKKPRPRSIIKKRTEVSWGRQVWKKKGPHIGEDHASN